MEHAAEALAGITEVGDQQSLAGRGNIWQILDLWNDYGGRPHSSKDPSFGTHFLAKYSPLFPGDLLIGLYFLVDANEATVHPEHDQGKEAGLGDLELLDQVTNARHSAAQDSRTLVSSRNSDGSGAGALRSQVSIK